MRDFILGGEVRQSAEKAADRTGALSALVSRGRVIEILCAASETNDLLDARDIVG